MKSIVILVVVLMAAFSQQTSLPEMRSAMQKFKNECRKEHPVSDELVKKFEHGEHVDDKSAQCLVKCVLDKAKFINDKGELQKEILSKSLPAGPDHDRILASIEKCTAIKGDELCSRMYAVHTCVYKAEPEFEKAIWQ